jgi:hypothetical protein
MAEHPEGFVSSLSLPNLPSPTRAIFGGDDTPQPVREVAREEVDNKFEQSSNTSSPSTSGISSEKLSAETSASSVHVEDLQEAVEPLRQVSNAPVLDIKIADASPALSAQALIEYVAPDEIEMAVPGAFRNAADPNEFSQLDAEFREGVAFVWIATAVTLLMIQIGLLAARERFRTGLKKRMGVIKGMPGRSWKMIGCCLSVFNEWFKMLLLFLGEVMGEWAAAFMKGFSKTF